MWLVSVPLFFSCTPCAFVAGVCTIIDSARAQSHANAYVVQCFLSSCAKVAGMKTFDDYWCAFISKSIVYSLALAGSGEPVVFWQLFSVSRSSAIFDNISVALWTTSGVTVEIQTHNTISCTGNAFFRGSDNIWIVFLQTWIVEIGPLRQAVLLSNVHLRWHYRRMQFNRCRAFRRVGWMLYGACCGSCFVGCWYNFWCIWRTLQCVSSWL